jgi:uncharacterized membrane protein
MQDDTTKPQSSGRWVKPLLGASLALNLAIVAMVAGIWLRPDGSGERLARAPGAGAFGAPYVLALPREDRRAVLRTIRQEVVADGLPDRQKRREMFRDVLASLRAEPFDLAALNAAVSSQANASIAVQAHAQKAWLDIVAGMTPEERASYAERVEAMLKRGPKRR